MTRPDNDPDRHLQRVRALLAKAESTTYTDEAAALSAKAHEMLAEHGEVDGMPGDQPVGLGAECGSLVGVRRGLRLGQ